jgi:hypothetical protein
MTDEKYFEKYEKGKLAKADKEYLAYIFALSQIDGSDKAHNKAMRDYAGFFFETELSEEKALKLIAGKAWVSGFNFAYKNAETLLKAKKEFEAKT